jgi:hypothetical protein
MTDWRAVGYGFVTIVVAGLFATLLPGIGHAFAGALGGFVAGYLAENGVVSGGWHGLLAGMVGGVVVAAFFAGIVTVVGTLGLGPLGALAGGAVFVAGVVIAFLLALDSALFGLLGGLVAQER